MSPAISRPGLEGDLMSPTLPEPDLRWHCLPRYPLRIEHHGDECLIFHPGSGDTFVLDAFQGYLLSLLRPEPQSPAQLAVQMASRLGLALDAALQAQLARQLSDLYGLGLIECESSIAP